MKFPRLLGLSVLLFAATFAAAAWSQAPGAYRAVDVDTESVIRMGDTVQHIDDKIEAGDAASQDFADVMGLPADDNHKWFVTVIGMRGCEPCERLKKAWLTDRNLLALANPTDPKSSWSHFNSYLWGDKSQDWRWRNLTIRAVPTIVVQPPRNGLRGDPTTVVFQGTWSGDSAKLTTDIAAAIRAYLAKVRTPNPPVAPTPPVGNLLDVDLFPQQKGDGGFGRSTSPYQGWIVSPPFNPNPAPVAPTLAPVVTPTNDADGLQIPPPAVAPTATPTPTAPAPGGEVAPKDPNDAVPEVVIVTEDGDGVAHDGRIARIMAMLQARHAPGIKLRTRIMDWRDLNDRYPVRRDELPAVLSVENGRIVDKVSARLLPLLEPRDTTLADLPWSSIVALFTGGFSLPAALAIGLWALRFLRSRRAAAGKEPVVSAERFERLHALVERLADRFQPKSDEPPAK